MTIIGLLLAALVGCLVALLIARSTFQRPASPEDRARWHAESDARIAALKAEWKACRAQGMTIDECNAAIAMKNF